MMKVELKKIEIEGVDASSFWPDDEYFFSILLNLSIGPEREYFSNNYSLKVCSCGFVREFYSAPTVLINTMITKNYDFEKIKSKIESLIDGCEGEDYDACVTKLSMIFLRNF